jgi:S-adenosylmethionine:tRNA ribosyltransferase-isomerase
MSTPFTFTLPNELSAKEPPERRGIARDEVLLCQQGNPFTCGLRDGININFGQGLTATVGDRDTYIPRLWHLRFSRSGTELIDSLYRLGRPIRYEYVSAPWDLDYYQTVYAKEPG